MNLKRRIEQAETAAEALQVQKLREEMENASPDELAALILNTLCCKDYAELRARRPFFSAMTDEQMHERFTQEWRVPLLREHFCKLAPSLIRRKWLAGKS